VTFWDTSAILPLLVQEPETEAMRARLSEDPHLTVWWGTPVECASALARLEREGVPSHTIEEASARLETLSAAWAEVEPHDEVREIARRLLRVHPLRAADALQLAAATLLAGHRPPSLSMVVLDGRLRTAAVKEGFKTA
jgi:predicted nucleic acid-binding protein